MSTDITFYAIYLLPIDVHHLQMKIIMDANLIVFIGFHFKSYLF